VTPVVSLLSSRTLAEIALSENIAWLRWLEVRQRSNSLLVSQFSLIKASRLVQAKLQLGPIRPDGVLERFAKRYLMPQSIVGSRSVSAARYNMLAARNGLDDLELFSICLSIQNEYDYICWDENEQAWAVSLDGQLKSILFRDVASGV
jgi:hypothetical protein